MSVVNGKEIFEPLQLDDHTEKVITDFIDQSIDKAIAEERKRIIEIIENTNEFSDSGDTLKKRIINLLDNK